MNKENLQKMADYIKTIPPETFHMSHYRDDSAFDRECKSVGCVIGHCTVLDDEENIPRDPTNNINFQKWSLKFTGLGIGDNDQKQDQWSWCFSAAWSHKDNTPTGASKRIEWLLKNGLPKNWRDQMTGFASLCYQ